MTITPTDATMAVLAGAPDQTGPSAPSGAADFLAAILQALAPMAGDATGQPGGDAAQDAGSADGEQATDAAALGLVAPGQVPAALALPATAAAVAAPGRANVAGGTPVTPTGPLGDIRVSVYAGTEGPTTGPTPGPTPGPSVGPTPGPTPGATAQPTDGQPTDGPPANDAPSAPAADGGSTTGDSSDPAAGGPGTTPAAASAPIVDATPAAPVTTAGLTPLSPQADAPAPAAHVTRQVFPEVTSLASRGDGTHRITLSLKPEALGEVRVVMTVRDGVVHVRLAAGHDAQRALLDGSPELTRLLESAGASETRIVVRDLGTATNTNTNTGTDTAGSGPDLSQGLGDSRPQDQHAGTRAQQQPATDGTNDTRTTRVTTGANPPRSVEPVTGTRTAGVDVTM